MTARGRAPSPTKAGGICVVAQGLCAFLGRTRGYIWHVPLDVPSDVPCFPSSKKIEHTMLLCGDLLKTYKSRGSFQNDGPVEPDFGDQGQDRLGQKPQPLGSEAPAPWVRSPKGTWVRTLPGEDKEKARGKKRAFRDRALLGLFASLRRPPGVECGDSVGVSLSRDLGLGPSHHDARYRPLATGDSG